MEDRSEWTSRGRQIVFPAPSPFPSLTVLIWGLCLPSSLAFDPNDLFIPLQAVAWSSSCHPCVLLLLPAGQQVMQEDALSPP